MNRSLFGIDRETGTDLKQRPKRDIHRIGTDNCGNDRKTVKELYELWTVIY